MPEQNIYQVSELNLAAKHLLAEHFGTISVIGEISNLSRPSSGHLYFSLKDENAQIRCALFRFQHQRIDFQLENGQQVLVQAQVSLYEARGDYQLIVSNVSLAGAGKLQIAFEKLKNELEKAGLFDDTHKQALPELPHCIGIISSVSGAALQDILKVLQKRFPAIPVKIYPATVQGDMAAKTIVKAIQKANQDQICDVLILARGGGSLEDLWPFNEKIVAHAIFGSDIPIVTGVGHQTDFTIADFVADVRAATPSAAAQIITPDVNEYLRYLKQQQKHITHLIQSLLKQYQLQLLHLQKRLQHPGDRLKQQAQQLDQLETQLKRTMRFILQEKKQQLSLCAEKIDTLSPLKTLQRGYTITTLKKTNKIVTQRAQVSSGEIIVTRLSDGEIESIVS